VGRPPSAPPAIAAGFVLETPRLWLRPYEAGDLDGLAPILTDPETMRFYPRPFTRLEAREWIERNLARYEHEGFGLWAMVAKGEGSFVGSCGPVEQVVEGVTEVELGWHVKRELWGRGLAPEAAAACRDHAFWTLGIDRLVSLILPENEPSRRVAEKIGMTVDRAVTFKGLGHLLYAIVREEASPGDGR
jgi:ribosomal-protein-alanine N-acetyltransferase